MTEYTDEQIRKATLRNLEAHSSFRHEPMALYALTENCEHTDPDANPKYDGVDELVDEWMARNCPGLTFPNFQGQGWPSWRVDCDLYLKNRKRGEAVIPLYAEYEREKILYEADHGYVCLLTPMGSCCPECSDGDEDSGFEPGSCYRLDNAKEAQAEFFYMFSDEWLEDRARIAS